jgi:hypothetical protein
VDMDKDKNDSGMAELIYDPLINFVRYALSLA